MKKILCLMVLLLFVAACGGNGNVVKSDVVEKDVVRVGSIDILPVLYYDIAKEKGFFDEVNIEIKENLVESSNLAAEALVQHNLDAVPVLSSVPVFGIEALNPGQIKMFITQPHQMGIDNFSALITLDNSGIESLHDLEGRKVGMYPGSTAASFLAELLKRNNVDVNKVEFVKMAPSQQLNALNSGAIDALYGYQPVITIAKLQGNVKVIHDQVYASVINPANIGTGAFSAKFLHEKPNVAERFVRAVLRGNQYLIDHPDEARQIAIKYYNLKPEVAKEVPLARTIPIEEADMQKYGELLDFLYDNEIISKKVDVRDMMWKTPAEQDVTLIGAIYPLTGVAGDVGEWVTEGTKLALEDYPFIKVIYEDDHYEAKNSVSAFRKLRQQGIEIFVGSGSGQAMAVGQLAEEEKVFYMSNTAVTPHFAELGDHTFRTSINADYESKITAELLYNELGIRRLALLCHNSEWGQGVKESLTEEFEKLGGEIIFSENYEQGATDFRSDLIKLKSVDPDAVYYVALKEAANLLKQVKELDVEIPLVTNSYGIVGSYIKEAAGEDAMEGVIFTTPSLGVGSEESLRKYEDFRRRYVEAYGDDPEMNAAQAYDAIALIAKGLQSGESLSDYLYSVKNYPGVSGDLNFNEDGDVIKPISVKVVKNGKFVDWGVEE